MTPVELIAQAEKVIAELDSLAASVASIPEIQTTIEALDGLMRNSVKLCRQTWGQRRDELLRSAGGKAELPDGRALRSTPKYKNTWDHARIMDKVVARSLYDEEGERLDEPVEIARRAVSLMAHTYVVPSTEPRSEGLLALGFETKLAATSSHVREGFEVKAVVPKKAS